METSLGYPSSPAVERVLAQLKGVRPALRGWVASLDFCPDLRAMLGHPGFLLVRQGNGLTHQLIHGLAGPSLNVLLDHFFQLRSQMNLYAHSLPQVLMPQPE